MKPDAVPAIPELLEATLFAAEKHREQRRKDADETPYINHPIAVANLLASVGGITDIDTLRAALLHDTIEDTDTTAEEIEALFGPKVRALVVEVTDNKDLAKQERKRLQVEHAPHKSPQAKVIKIADKIANLQDLASSPPAGWPAERIREYVSWSEKVVKGCKGQNPALEELFRETADALMRR